MDFESVQNYYEHLVFAEIMETVKERNLDVGEDYLEDVACVTLNHLPSRYVRHHVDMIFYMTAEELQIMIESVKRAVADAFVFVEKHKR